MKEAVDMSVAWKTLRAAEKAYTSAKNDYITDYDEYRKKKNIEDYAKLALTARETVLKTAATDLDTDEKKDDKSAGYYVDS